MKFRERATKTTAGCGFPTADRVISKEFRRPPRNSFCSWCVAMSADVVIGRTLACCFHPAAAWRRVSGSGKALIVGLYFAVAYLGVLTVLLAK